MCSFCCHCQKCENSFIYTEVIVVVMYWAAIYLEVLVIKYEMQQHYKL